VRFLNSRHALWLTALLTLQGAAYYATASRPELTPPVGPLASFPAALPGWLTAGDYPVAPEIQEVLKADDILNRIYADPSGRSRVDFFIAYFKTQRTGATPHSPKNCLPGSGFEPVEPPRIVSIQVVGSAVPVTANRYVVARGEDKVAVLYWYQGHGRTIANEFSAKFWLVADSIRYRRSDTALIKVQVPVGEADSSDAVRTAIAFVQAAYPAIAAQLPL
jgi:EpsI family protein